ncbi:thioesterase II family protein [Actinoplanes sp. N902-109]|uniref:thioesterase II family protein n=1 Tax=Actinoplanes sp. (strain N902-109) TaxID=649831 RepID=UPI0003294C39|nr:alpha/beta fold hydrolase [Actinoplanes sp. N902-109]AGL12180.1 putative thioesterase [Actinoplanes sp. N902-109]AGL16470.1 putative thioesterase [Actinoplanes sp. N902-109]
MTDTRNGDAAKWLTVFTPAPQSSVRLVCFPYAGGSGSFFLPISRALAPTVEVLAVQYPARQTRRLEPGIDNIPDFADQIFAAVRQSTDKPLAFFGHSMGAVLAYEVALRFQQAGLPSPVRLFVSGRRAPSKYRDERFHAAPDAEFIAELKGLGGPNSAFLNDPEMLEMVLPALRSDYTAIERYRHEPGRTLDCPISAFVGDSDPRASLDEVRAWAQHTTGPFDLEIFQGDHFYLIGQGPQLIELIAKKLAG